MAGILWDIKKKKADQDFLHSTVDVDSCTGKTVRCKRFILIPGAYKSVISNGC